MALILVMIVSLLLLLVPLGVAVANEGALPLARYEVDRSAALAAADAGVDDYINRLNNNFLYWQSSVPATGKYQPTAPSDGNGALTGWVRTSSLGTSAYCYTVDYQYSGGTFAYNSGLSAVSGIVLLTVYGFSSPNPIALPAPVASNPASPTANPNMCSGAVPKGGVEKTVQVQLRQQGFLDYAQLTDLNLVDPLLDNGTCSAASTPKPYAYNHPDCPSSQINYWGTGNQATGPVRSNDDFYICGNPVFQGQITSDDTSSPGSHFGWTDPANSCGGDNPVFNNVAYQASPPGSIQQGSSAINLPTTDANVALFAKAAGGCYYLGPTSIVVSGSSVTVTSPMSVGNATTNAFCTSPTGTATFTLGQLSGGVIFVDNTTGNCGSAFGNNLKWTGDTCINGSGQGDVFISGSNIGGPMTVAAADNIFIDGSVTVSSLASSSQSVVGLIATNNVFLAHGVNGGATVYGSEPFYGTNPSTQSVATPAGWGSSDCNGSTTAPLCNLTIDAALLTLQHTFGVQNFATGPPFGQVVIHGALAEEYMDIDGSFGSCSYAVPATQTTAAQTTQLCSGVNAVYWYDARLSHLSPPHFLSPGNTQWIRLSYEECPPKSGCLS